MIPADVRAFGAHAAEPRPYTGMTKRTMLGVAIIGLLVAGFAGFKLGFFAPSLAQIRGTPIEATPLVGLSGRKHSFHELRGQATTVYFWATWCRPCLAHLSALAKGERTPPNTRFLPVALEEDPQAVAATLLQLGYREPVWVATDGMGLLQRRFAGNSKRAIPYVVELSATGDIEGARYGE